MRIYVVGLLLAAPVAAQVVQDEIYSRQMIKVQLGITPAVGAETTASVGSRLYQRQRVTFTRLTQVDAKLSFGSSFAGKAIFAGEKLVAVQEDGPIIACRYEGYSYSRKTCGVDADRDGMFEAGIADADNNSTILPAKAPVRYAPIHDNPVPDPDGAFMTELTYLGVAGPTLRLGYREFLNDMARPAFSDEVTFTLSGKFPETIVYKDMVIDVLGVSNSGLRYVIRSVGRP